MVGKRPAFQFYPADWKADDALMSCSLSAQGLWIYLLCVMHYCDPYGHLVTRAGEAMPTKQLAKLARATEVEIAMLLDELAEARVFSITDQGVIYSRRMVADYERYLERSSSGRAGGRSSRQAIASTNVQATAKQQLPQSDNTSSSSSSSSSSSKEHMVDEIDRVPFDEIWKLVPVGRKVAKEEARKLWDGKKNTNAELRITPEETHVIMKRYPLHVEMWRRDATPTSKIPHLRTWLSQSRWFDEIDDAGSDEPWAADCFRLSCEEKHGDDPDWDAYRDWATDYSLEHGPRTSPTFEEFKTGGADG